MDNDHQLAMAVLKLGAAFAPLIVILFLCKILKETEKTLGNFANSLQNGLQRAGNRGTNLATRAAKNSTPGLRVQQLLNERRQSRVRTAQDQNQQLIGGGGPLSGLIRRAVVGTDSARQQDLLERTRKAYQDRTQGSLQGKNPIAIGDLAQMGRGETVDDYLLRRTDLQAGLASTDARTRSNTQQRVAALREMHRQFGDQIGTDDFREAALHAAVAVGSNTDDVMRGMATYVAQYRGSDADLAQSMGRVAQTAKGAGFAEYSAVGFQGTQATGRHFEQYQIKPPSSVIGNMDLSKQERDQFYIDPTDPDKAQAYVAHGSPPTGRTALGDAIYGRLMSGAVGTEDAVRNAMLRDLSMARRAKPFQTEYLALVRQADLARGTPAGTAGSLEDRLNDMINKA